MKEVKKYKVTCEDGHTKTVDLDILQEICVTNECPKCEADIVEMDPPLIHVQCTGCEQYDENSHWSDVVGSIDILECYRCQQAFGHDGDIRVVGSSQHRSNIFESFVDRFDYRDFVRPERPDYWDLVIHFTSQENLLSILKAKSILAKPTGYFRRQTKISRAVCLTEIPIDFVKELTTSFGDYGLAFRKADILKAGGGPTLDMKPNLIKQQLKSGGFCDAIKPFINKIDKEFYYIFEREWRVPKDIRFKTIPPVCLIIPRQRNNAHIYSSDWALIENAGWQYSILQPKHLV